MLSIGGITYTGDWDTALSQNPAQLGQQRRRGRPAARRRHRDRLRGQLGAEPAGLQAFINAYRSVLPYDATGADPAARLTIDLAAGDRWLIELDQYATADWLDTRHPGARLRQRDGAQQAADRLRRRVELAGAPRPASPTTTRRSRRWPRRSSPAASTSPRATRSRPSAPNFAARVQNATGALDRRTPHPTARAPPPACSATCSGPPRRPSTRGVTTDPPNTCEGGVGVGASTYSRSRSRCRPSGRADGPGFRAGAEPGRGGRAPERAGPARGWARGRLVRALQPGRQGMSEYAASPTRSTVL